MPNNSVGFLEFNSFLFLNPKLCTTFRLLSSFSAGQEYLTYFAGFSSFNCQREEGTFFQKAFIAKLHNQIGSNSCVFRSHQEKRLIAPAQHRSDLKSVD